MKAVQEQITIVSINTDNDCKMPCDTGCFTAAVAATFGAEPKPASFENNPRFNPAANAAPMPPATASSQPSALATIVPMIRGNSVMFIAITTSAMRM